MVVEPRGLRPDAVYALCMLSKPGSLWLVDVLLRKNQCEIGHVTGTPRYLFKMPGSWLVMSILSVSESSLISNSLYQERS